MTRHAHPLQKGPGARDIHPSRGPGTRDTLLSLDRVTDNAVVFIIFDSCALQTVVADSIKSYCPVPHLL